MISARLDVTLTLNGPILTHASAAGAYGIDTPMACDAQGRYCLPGTLVKGRLLDAWRELSQVSGGAFAPDLKALLGYECGNPEHDGDPVTPQRARLHFGDFSCERTGSDRTLFRIQIDPERGAVQKGAYQAIEAPFGPGERVEFIGAIRFAAKGPGEAKDISDQVEQGLRWITSLGAVRTAGFGRLLDVKVTFVPDSAALTADAKATGAEARDIALTLNAPFCISRHRADENLFESEAVIPGGVLKGALAATWLSLLGKDPNGEITEATDRDRPDLGKSFHRLRVTHAFPSPEGQLSRPVVAPLSLVKVKSQRYDVALADGPVLVDGQSPAFAVDWKSREDVDADFGWLKREADGSLHGPRRELRVRTAIDAGTRRGAEGKLFAYEMVVQEGFVWRATIDLADVPTSDRLTVERQLGEILAHGLHGIGKTKASATMSFPRQTVSPHVKSDGLDERPWVLTLQTPALLVSTDGLDETNGAEELHQRYAAAFDELSLHTLRLVRYFATERLAGGFYLHKRFAGGKPYRPYLLTEEGSVFVLEPAAADRARASIETWSKHGLPLPAWAGPNDGTAWRTCPYVRENGYGEVAVNLETHRRSGPPAGKLAHVALLGGK